MSKNPHSLDPGHASILQGSQFHPHAGQKHSPQAQKLVTATIIVLL